MSNNKSSEKQRSYEKPTDDTQKQRKATAKQLAAFMKEANAQDSGIDAKSVKSIAKKVKKSTEEEAAKKAEQEKKTMTGEKPKVDAGSASKGAWDDLMAQVEARANAMAAYGREIGGNPLSRAKYLAKEAPDVAKKVGQFSKENMEKGAEEIGLNKVLRGMKSVAQSSGMIKPKDSTDSTPPTPTL